MAADRKACANPDCDNTIGKDIPSSFCFTCSSELAFQERELEKDLDRVLSLEAEFVQWCVDNDHPNPHD